VGIRLDKRELPLRIGHTNAAAAPYKSRLSYLLSNLFGYSSSCETPGDDLTK
jgi:hypothetical protein